MEPDVLSKDLAAYRDAQKRDDRQRAQQIVDRAARRGRRAGTSVSTSGSARCLLMPFTTGTATVTFVRQATVRPALPPPPTATAAATATAEALSACWEAGGVSGAEVRLSWRWRVPPANPDKEAR